jgi:hypothetical protein
MRQSPRKHHAAMPAFPPMSATHLWKLLPSPGLAAQFPLMYATARWAGKLTTDPRPIRLACSKPPNFASFSAHLTHGFSRHKLNRYRLFPQANFLDRTSSKAHCGTHCGFSRRSHGESAKRAFGGRCEDLPRRAKPSTRFVGTLLVLKRLSSRGCRGRGPANPDARADPEDAGDRANQISFCGPTPWLEEHKWRREQFANPCTLATLIQLALAPCSNWLRHCHGVNSVLPSSIPFVSL